MTPQEAFALLPRTVRIGPYDFEVVGWTAIESNSCKRYGECSTQEQKIRICQDVSSCVKLVDTFLHEVLHAIFWASCVGEEDGEERTVSMVSTALVLFFRDNPEVLKWLDTTLASPPPYKHEPTETVTWCTEMPGPNGHGVGK